MTKVARVTSLCLTSYNGQRIVELKINWKNKTHILITVSTNGTFKRVLLLQRGTGNLRWNQFSNNDLHTIQVIELQELATDTFDVQRKLEIVIKPELLQDACATLMVDCQSTMYEKNYKKLTNSFGYQFQADFVIGQHLVNPHVLELHKRTMAKTLNFVIVYNMKSQQEYLILTDCNTASLLQLPSRADYEVRCITFRTELDEKMPYYRLIYPIQQIISNILHVKIPMDQEILGQLLEKAQVFCQKNKRYPGSYEIQQFYRNKPLHYFHKILSEKNGIMAKYIKDNNGDPYSAINRRINGLFFSASLDTRTMSPPNFSYFGDIRAFIPATELFAPHTRIYFADFYCHNIVHYVTLVITKRYSVEDTFCQQWLIKLDMENNPFFTVQSKSLFPRLDPQFFNSLINARQGSPFSTPAVQRGFSARMKTFTMISVNKFHIEFLYTDDVDIKGKKLVRVEGRGASKPDGIPKKKYCPICNLD